MKHSGGVRWFSTTINRISRSLHNLDSKASESEVSEVAELEESPSNNETQDLGINLNTNYQNEVDKLDNIFTELSNEFDILLRPPKTRLIIYILQVII